MRLQKAKPNLVLEATRRIYLGGNGSSVKKKKKNRENFALTFPS